MRYYTITASSLLFFMCLTAAGFTQADQDRARSTGQMETGRLTLRFYERHPLGVQDVLAARLRGTLPPEKFHIPLKEYRLTWETFSAYIPPAYDGSEAFGLFVWVSPGNSGGLPKAYEDFLSRHRLIWIGGDGIGNERSASDRMRLTMDGMYNMLQRYSIDPERIYIGGFSGGGRISSKLAFLYPELFAGAFYMMGCNYYRDLSITVQGEQMTIPGFSPHLDKALIEQAVNNRYVFLTAEKDFNRTDTNVVLKAYKAEGVKFATYIEIPGWEHRFIPVEWFELAVEALDRPLRLCREPQDTYDVSERMDDVIVRMQGEIQPVKTIIHLKRMNEIAENRDERSAIRDLLRTLLKDKNVKMLYELVVDVRNFHESLCREGTTMRTTDIVIDLTSKIERFLESKSSDALLSEARELLAEL